MIFIELIYDTLKTSQKNLCGLPIVLIGVPLVLYGNDSSAEKGIHGLIAMTRQVKLIDLFSKS